MGFAATLQTTFQPKTNLQQHCKLLFSQKQTCSSTANYFSAKNKLAAALQTTFRQKTNLQQHCKLLFITKQTCSNTANHFSTKNRLAAALQITYQWKATFIFSIKTRSMSHFIDHPTISFQISSETRLARRCMQGLSIHIKKSAIPYLYLSF